jgi:hypothetical protein
MKMVTKDFDQEREDAYELLLKDVTTEGQEAARAMLAEAAKGTLLECR